MKYYLVIKKLPIYDNMDEPREHYFSWNKPGIEKQILDNPTCWWNLGKKNKLS